MSFLTCFSRSTFKYPNLVSVSRFEESILDLNFPQKGSQSSTLPLNFVIDNFGSFAAVDDFVAPDSSAAAFSCSRAFSNYSLCSSSCRSNSMFFLCFSIASRSFSSRSMAFIAL